MFPAKNYKNLNVLDFFEIPQPRFKKQFWSRSSDQKGKIIKGGLNYPIPSFFAKGFLNFFRRGATD